MGFHAWDAALYFLVFFFFEKDLLVTLENNI